MKPRRKFNSLDHLTRKFLINQRLAIVSLTKRCNLNCRYCRYNLDKWYDALSQPSRNIDLPKEAWNDLVKVLKEKNVGEILLTGGEPLEYPYLKDLLLVLKNNKIIFSFHTNGFSNKWPEMIEFLEQNKLFPNIHLSTELYQDLQRDIRGINELPIEFIKEITKRGMNIELKITLHQKILPYLDDLETCLQAWLQHGAKSFRFQPVAATGTDFPKGLILKKDFIIFLQELLRLKNEGVFKQAIRNSEESFQMTMDILKGIKPSSKLINRCQMKDKIIFINPDFEILDCRTLWGKPQNVPCDSVFDLVCCGFQN